MFRMVFDHLGDLEEKKNYGHRHMDSGTDEKDVNGYTEE